MPEIIISSIKFIRALIVGLIVIGGQTVSIGFTYADDAAQGDTGAPENLAANYNLNFSNESSVYPIKVDFRQDADCMYDPGDPSFRVSPNGTYSHSIEDDNNINHSCHGQVKEIFWDVTVVNSAEAALGKCKVAFISQ